MSDVMEITTEEFSQIQNQLVDLRTKQFEYEESDKRQKAEIQKLQKKNKEIELDCKKLQYVVQKSQDKSTFKKFAEENASYKKDKQNLIAEHEEQTNALKENAKLMFTAQQELQLKHDEILKEKERLEKKIVEMKKQDTQQQTNIDSTILDELKTELEKNQKGIEFIEKISSEIFLKELVNKLFEKEEVEDKKEDEDDEDDSIEKMKEKFEKIWNKEIIEGKNNVELKKIENSIQFSKPDEDLIINISNLEEKLEKKQEEIQKITENYETQINIWIEKNKDNKEKILNLNKEIDELKENNKKLKESQMNELKEKEKEIENLKKEIEKIQIDRDNILSSLLKLQEERVDFVKDSDQQQKKIYNTQQVMKDMSMKLKESLDESNQKQNEIDQLKVKLTELEPIIEKGKNFDSLNKSHSQEVSKNNSLSDENEQMKIEIEDYQKKINFLDEDNKKKNTKIKIHIDTINDINNKLTKILSEKDQVLQKMKMMELEFDDVSKKNEKKIEKLEKVVKNTDDLYQSYIELFSKSILISVELSVNNENVNCLNLELQNINEKMKNIKIEKETFKEKYEKSEQRIKDLKVEFTSRSKMKEKQLKELKSLLIEKQKEEENNTTITPSNSNNNLMKQSNSNTNIMSGNSLNTPKRIHSRENSFNNMKSISSGSDDNTSLVNDLETSQIMKENNQLLIRVGELQTIKWKMEERLRVLSISIEQLKEDVEKKKQIITYYMQKEKLGRLTPEQEKNKKEMMQKSKKMDPKILQESFNQMQQVMEETILQNIQLQSHIKTLGSEIQRLLNENKKLQESK
eukprot:gene4693-8265_t